MLFCARTGKRHELYPSKVVTLKLTVFIDELPQALDPSWGANGDDYAAFLGELLDEWGG